jgi:II/X family phage/plasmid replication protein
MIDWITAEVPVTFPGPGVINGGRVLTLDPSGEVEYMSDRWHVAEGSHSSKLVLKGIYPASGERFLGWTVGVLQISGNPAKWLQGHNLFGCSDMRVLVFRVMEKLCDVLDLPATNYDRLLWSRGVFYLSRVDVTRMYDVGSPERVLDWLASASQVVHSRYQAAGNEHGTTLYVGKHSRRVSLKIYDKLAELKVRGHGLPDTLPADWYYRLFDWASGKLRVEATFRSMWLKDHGRFLGMAWPPEWAERLLDERIGGLEMSDTMRLSDEYIGKLPGKLALIYEAWRNGRDIRSIYTDRHYYRLRAQLLPYGIDIAHVRPREVVAENQYLLGAPLKSFLQPGGGAPVPDWAIDTPLYVSA